MPADDPIAKLALAALDAAAEVDALVQPGAAAGRPGFQVLYAYATDPAFRPPAGFADMLAADAALRGDLARLLGNVSAIAMPRLAAAASGRVDRREVAGASLRLIPSQSRPAQTYLTVTLTDPAAAPKQMIVIGEGVGVLRLDLPAPSDGAVQVILDTDGPMALALGDPQTEVFFR